MGKNKKKRAKPKGAKPKRSAGGSRSKPAASKPSGPLDSESPRGPSLDEGPYRGDASQAIPERKAWHILVPVLIGTLLVVGLSAYQQISVHAERERDEERFQREKAKTELRKQDQADSAPVGSG